MTVGETRNITIKSNSTDLRHNWSNTNSRQSARPETEVTRTIEKTSYSISKKSFSSSNMSFQSSSFLGLQSLVTLSGFLMVMLAVSSPALAGPLPAPSDEDHAAQSGILASDCSKTGLNQQLNNGEHFYPNKPAFGVLPFNQTIQQRQTITPDDMPYPDVATTTTCPAEHEVREDWSTSAAATCPWTYEEDHDADRYPSVIARAVCRCQGCLDPYTGKASPDLECREVMYTMGVLRNNGCVEGVLKYDFEWYKVPVACTCMRKVSSAIRPPDIIG